MRCVRVENQGQHGVVLIDVGLMVRVIRNHVTESPPMLPFFVYWDVRMLDLHGHTTVDLTPYTIGAEHNGFSPYQLFSPGREGGVLQQMSDI